MEKNCFFSSLAFFSYIVIATISMAFAQNITTDQAALLALRAHITSDPFGITTNNWSATTSVCNWVGIICGVKHKRVTSLNFSFMGLTGTFPPEVGTLSFLTYVTIKNNSFHDPLPIELTNLPRLKMMSLGNNNFSGEIPTWIGRLPRMEELYLYGNQFSGLIPTSLFNLTSLIMLNLQENQLSGKVLHNSLVQTEGQPGGFQIYSNFALLGLWSKVYSCFIGSIPREIGNLTLLQDLYLNSNQLTGKTN